MKAQRATDGAAHSDTEGSEPGARETTGGRTELEAIADASATHAESQATGDESAPIAIGGLGLGWLAGEGDAFELRTAMGTFPARLDAALHRAVASTARSRNEAVLYTRDAEGAYVVVGALRTAPTPGVDEMDEIRLEAKRIHIEATEETQVRSGAAVIAVRAIGEVETYADRILSRAEEVQKIVARMLRLN